MNDFRHAYRQLTKRPGFSVVVIAMLALGLGATTAMFSMFHTVLMRPLPVPESSQLVNLGAPGPKPGSTQCNFAGDCEYVFSYPMFRDLEAQQSVFTGIAAHRGFDANLSYGNRSSASFGMFVSGGYFDVLNLRPAAGRLIGPQDEPGIGESPVAVLTYDYWRNDFGADPGVIGRTLTVNGQPLTIIGVAPEAFSGTTFGMQPRVFVPLTLRWLLQPTSPRNEADRRAYWIYLFARLRPDVSMEQAAAGINGLYGGILNEIEVPLNAEMPPNLIEQFRQRQITLEPGARGQSWVPSNAARPLTLLLAVTAVVLLIVCVNIANLLLARGASRSGEMAIRASIGAGRGHLIRQLLTENAVLALLGGIGSLFVAAITLRAISAMLPVEAGAGVELGLDPVAVAFAAAISLATVLLFGLAPAVQAARTNPGIVVKGQAAQGAGGRGMARFRASLAVTQIAFSMMLLVLAGLFAQSLLNLARVNLGITVDSLVTFTAAPRLNGYDPERAMGLYDRIEQELAAQPGVVSVASAMVPLLTNSNVGTSLTVEGFESAPGVDTNASMNQVSPGFFATLSIPLLAGRDFGDTDLLDSPRVAVVNEAFVRKFDLGDDAIGKRFGFAGGGSGEMDIEIVGVAADAKYSTVKAEIPPQHFLARRQNENIGALSFYVRAGLDASALVQMIGTTVARIDPDLPVSNLMTMRDAVRDNVFLDRLVAILSAAFAALATLLAAIGLYGVLAYNVTQRTREMGLRLALGATPARVRAGVLKQVGRMAVFGIGIGLVAALGLGRAAEALLFGLAGHDPVVLVAAVAVLAAVVAAAGYFPARRASRVAPMEALRYE